MFDLRLIGFYAGLKLHYQGALSIDAQAAGKIARREIEDALELCSGALQLGLIATQIGLCLAQGRLEGARVKLSEDVAGVHFLALPKGKLLQLPVDPGAHGDRVERLHRSEAEDVDRHIPLLGCAGNDGNRRIARGDPAGLHPAAWRNTARPDVGGPNKAGRQDCHRHERERPNDWMQAHCFFHLEETRQRGRRSDPTELRWHPAVREADRRQDASLSPGSLGAPCWMVSGRHRRAASNAKNATVDKRRQRRLWLGSPKPVLSGNRVSLHNLSASSRRASMLLKHLKNCH